MAEKQARLNKKITNCLRDDYGLEVASLQQLSLGADMNASVYKAQTYDQSSYFVKLKHGHHHDSSVIVFSLLQDAEIQQIISPIKTNQGQLIQHMDDSTLIVYPFVEGRNGFSCHLTDDQWAALGRVLRQVHEVGVPGSIQNRFRRENYSPKWREVVKSLYSYIETEPTVDAIGLKLLTFMKEYKIEIQRLVDRAEQLAHRIREQTPKFVLCHSDIHGGNVLLDGNGMIYIVDWDDPIMAPKERDLMFIGGGVGNIWNCPHEKEFFYSGYGKAEINQELLAYYRYERIVQDIAEYGEALLLTRAGGEDSAEMYKHFVAMFEPRGVVEIAFKTDEELIP